MRSRNGQATVEAAVTLPVLIIVAVIAVNALAFFSECAAFDRAFGNAVRAHAAAPAYGQDVHASCALVQQELSAAFDADTMSVSVTASERFGQTTFTGTLTYAPTLFGLGMASDVFGVALPSLSHNTSLALSPYKPGVII